MIATAIMIASSIKREDPMQPQEISPKLYGGEFGDTLEQLKARVPFTKDMQGLGFDGDARKVGAVLLLAGVSGELIEHIEQLTAELESVRSMTVMLNEREWAEHAGRGEIAQGLEQAITSIHGELADAAHSKNVLEFFLAVGFDDQLAAKLDEHADQVTAGLDGGDTNNPAEHFQVMESLYRHAKETGLWPRAEVSA